MGLWGRRKWTTAKRKGRRNEATSWEGKKNDNDDDNDDNDDDDNDNDGHNHHHHHDHRHHHHNSLGGGVDIGDDNGEGRMMMETLV